MTSRPSTAAPILAVLAVMLVTIGAYVGGYLCLGRMIDFEKLRYRYFAYPWIATIFSPAASVETLVIGKTVETVYEGQEVLIPIVG
jgi:hypothetical protein